MHISTVNISQTVKAVGLTYLMPSSRKSGMGFQCIHIYILPWPIVMVQTKALHIFTADVSNMVTRNNASPCSFWREWVYVVGWLVNSDMIVYNTSILLSAYVSKLLWPLLWCKPQFYSVSPILHHVVFGTTACPSFSLRKLFNPFNS